MEAEDLFRITMVFDYDERVYTSWVTIHLFLLKAIFHSLFVNSGYRKRHVSDAVNLHSARWFQCRQ